MFSVLQCPESDHFFIWFQANFSNIEAYTVHISSDNHKAKCAESSAPQQLVEPTGLDQLLNRIRNNPQSPYECTVCNVRTTGEDNFRMHLEGSKHRKKVQQAGSFPVTSDSLLPVAQAPLFR